MSITNQIIIPVVEGREPAHQQKVSVPGAMVLTPHKEDSANQPILWRKTSSAFKKFKEKRDRRRHPLPEAELQAENLPYTGPTRLYKLATGLNDPQKMQQQSPEGHTWSIPYGYYDPNQAPLYKATTTEAESAEIDNSLRAMMLSKKCSKASVRMEDQNREQMINKIQPFPSRMDAEISVQSIPVRDDDPFIIIRKGSNHYRNNKQFKTKLIKKQSSSPKAKQTEDKTFKSIMIPNKSIESLSEQAEIKNQTSSRPKAAEFIAPININEMKEKQQGEGLFKKKKQQVVIQIQSSPQDQAQSQRGSWGSSGGDHRIECD